MIALEGKDPGVWWLFYALPIRSVTIAKGPAVFVLLARQTHLAIALSRRNTGGPRFGMRVSPCFHGISTASNTASSIEALLGSISLLGSTILFAHYGIFDNGDMVRSLQLKSAFVCVLITF